MPNSQTHSVLSASKIAVSDQASAYWLRQRRVRIDTTTVQHLPPGTNAPESFQLLLPGQQPVSRYKLPDAVDRVLKISLPDDLGDPLSANGIYHQTFELFDNDQHHIKGFFRGLDQQMKESFNLSLVPVNVASIFLKDILNAAELNLAAEKRNALDHQRSVTLPMTEASWRASVDGLMETLWAFGATTPMVSFEPSWRLVDPAYQPMIQKTWEPGTIRPDVVLASQVLNEPPPSKRADVLRAIGMDSRMYRIIAQLQPVINTVETQCLAEFPTINLSCLIVEYKKVSGSHHVRQLVMAMVTSLHHLWTMGL